MASKESDRIIGWTDQIVDWYAVYQTGGDIVTRVVTAVALVETDGGTAEERRRLVGMVREGMRVMPAEQVSGGEAHFCGYAQSGSDLEEFRKKARRHTVGAGAPSSWFG